MKVRNFNSLAKYYDFLLFISSGKIIANSQKELLPFLPLVKNVCIAGGGTGTFLLDFLRMHHSVKVVYIDSSSEMIRLSREKIEAFDRSLLPDIQFICSEIEQFETTKTFDLIVTNFFLDVFEESELVVVLKKLSNCLSDEGHWYYTDFQKVKTPLLKKYMTGFILKILYGFFRITCHIKAGQLVSTKELFLKAGFKKNISREFFFGFINTTLYRKSCSQPFLFSEIK